MARRRLLKSYFYVEYNGQKYLNGGTATVPPFEATGGTSSFTIHSSRAWEINNIPAWITLSKTEGKRGSTLVNLTANTNSGSGTRNGELHVGLKYFLDTKNINIDLSQESIGSAYITVTFVNNPVSATVTTNTFSLNCSEIDMSTLGYYSPESDGIISCNMTNSSVTFAQNDEYTDRTIKLAISGLSTVGQFVSGSATFTQNKKIVTPSLSIAYTGTGESASSGATTAFTLTKNYVTAITRYAVSPTTASVSNTGQTGVTVQFPANQTETSKTYTLSVSGTDVYGEIQTASTTFTQSADTYTFRLNPTAYTASSTDVQYAYAIVSSNVSDIGVSNRTGAITGASINGNNVVVNFEQNQTQDDKTGTVTISGKTVGGRTVTATGNLTQTAAGSVSLSIVYNGSNLTPASGSTNNFTITAVNVTVTGYSANNGATVSNTGTTSVTLNYPVNQTENATSYTVKVLGKDAFNNDVSASCVVNQVADTYSFSVTPSAQTVEWVATEAKFTTSQTNVTNVGYYSTTSQNINSCTVSGNVYTAAISVNETSNDKAIKFVASGKTRGGRTVYATGTTIQQGKPAGENILVNLNLKQNSAGTWYVLTTCATETFPVTLVYDGSSFNTSTNNGSYTATPFATSVGTNIGTISGTNQYVSGSLVYNVSYSQNTTPYQESVASVTPQSVSLKYDDYNFLANGSASTTQRLSHPTAFTVNYQIVYQNTFDSSTRTVASSVNDVNLITAVRGTAANGGSMDSSFNISAQNRGTITGNSRTVYTVTGVSYTLCGSTYSTSLTSSAFTQEANTMTETVNTSTRTSYTARPEEYQNIHVLVCATTYTLAASGGSQSVTIFESGQTRDVSATTVYTDSAITRTYTSGSEEHVTLTDQTGAAGSDVYGSWTTYTATPNVTTAVTGNSLSYDDRNDVVEADYLGTTITNADTNRLGVTARSSVDSSVYDYAIFNQEANTVSQNVSTSTRNEYASLPEEYQNIYVLVCANTYTLAAGGESEYVTTFESGQTRDVSATTVYTDSAVTYNYRSGAVEHETIADDEGEAGSNVYGSWTTYTATPNVTTATTGNSLSYNNGNNILTASNLGTTITTSDTNKLGVTATSTVNSSVSDSAMFSQEANTMTETVTPSTRTTYAALPDEYQDIHVVVDPDATLPASGGSVSVTIYESGRTRSVSSTTVYTDSSVTQTYTSGAENHRTITDQTGAAGSDVYGSWTTYIERPAITTAVTGSSLSYNAGNSAVTASDLGTTETTSSTNRLVITGRSNKNSSITDTATFTQEANEKTASCNMIVNPASVTLKDNAKTANVTVTSTTRYDYTSGAYNTAATAPNVSVSGDSTHFSVEEGLPTGSSFDYTIRADSSYSNVGMSSNLAYAKFTSPNCPSTNNSVAISYSGDIQYDLVIDDVWLQYHPLTISGVRADYWGFGMTVSISPNNPSLAWVAIIRVNVRYEVDGIQRTYNGDVEVHGVGTSRANITTTDSDFVAAGSSSTDYGIYFKTAPDEQPAYDYFEVISIERE